MIKLLDIQPKDIHLLLDIPLTDLEKLIIVLENSTFNYNSEKKEERDLAEYLTETLYPNLKAVLEATQEATHGT